MGQLVNEYNDFLISPQEDEPLKGAPSQCVPARGLCLRHDRLSAKLSVGFSPLCLVCSWQMSPAQPLVSHRPVLHQLSRRGWHLRSQWVPPENEPS